MKDKKELGKEIEEMKKAKCAWPGCEEKQFMHCGIQLVKPNEKGQPVPVKDVSLGVPFCKYHFMMARFCAVMESPTNKTQQMLLAPVQETAIAECVISGMIMSGRLQEMLETTKQAEVKHKELEKEMEKKKNETQTKNAEQEADKSADIDRNK